MTQFLANAAILLLACLGFYGWGCLARWMTGTGAGMHTVTVAAGVAVVLFVGGILNIAGVATTATLWGVCGIGISLGIVGLVLRAVQIQKATRRQPVSWIEAVSSGALIALVTGFAIWTQLPPDAFNFHDDFQKYFAHPVRMLATGTLTGSLLSALGAETLGGMAFLHGFVLSFAPIEYINGVDAVFGLALLLCLGAAAGWGRPKVVPGALIAPLLIAAVNPQYVNVSPLYLGAALMAAAVLLTADRRESAPPSPWLLGLVYSGLIVLKPSFGLFVALHAPCAIVIVAFTASSWRRVAAWTAQATVTGAAALAPWLLLHSAHHFASGSPDPVAVGDEPSLGFGLFSTEPLLYGASPANYAALVGLSIFSALLALLSLRSADSQQPLREPLGIVAAAAVVVVCYLVMMLVMPPILAGPSTSLRYAIPFLLGTVPIVAALSLGLPKPSHAAIPLLGTLAVAAWFVPSATARYEQALDHHTILGFAALATSQSYQANTRIALSDEARAEVRAMQARIPTNVPFIAWIAQPFHLDYRRNPVIDVDPAGLANPWAKIPPGVQYVLWEYKGYGVRTPQHYMQWSREPGRHEREMALRSLNFGKMLDEEVKRGDILHADERFVLFRIQGRS